MSIERERLISIVEFAQQSARLRSTPVGTVSQHGIFSLYEHQLHSLPGITLNSVGGDGADEVWLIVKRLYETKPPSVASEYLKPWIQMSQGPVEEPKLRSAVDGKSLIEAGTHCSSSDTEDNLRKNQKPSIDPAISILLSEYEHTAIVHAHFQSYLDSKWKPWAEVEKIRRKTIQIYAQLFTLKQKLEGGIVEAQLELAWGSGIGIWQHANGNVSYPLIVRLCEITLNPVSSDIEIRPREQDARLEVDWYSSVDNPGVAELEKTAKTFFTGSSATFSPFDRGTFEPLLRSAVTHLDGNGIYWPNEVSPEDRSLPKADPKLKVTDTWVMFARPRTNSIFIQDLERLKLEALEIEDILDFPPAVVSLVREPSHDNSIVKLHSYRGVSGSYESASANSDPVRDLYFPKPFNDEQVRIVQLLEASEGVVVQGPPGTGKTHTIANVICHYLAEGKRVLVTSMKEPALTVLQEQLPEEIRTLAISLLSSEQEGMKQFEHAIHRIASEVQSLDRNATEKQIKYLDESIDSLHGKLSSIDRSISQWAKKNLTKISIDGEMIEPQEAATEVVSQVGNFEWLPDELDVTPEFEPKFSDADIIQLREARRNLGKDIDYLNLMLPQVVDFPDANTLIQIHQDLSQFETLKKAIDQGVVPALADSSQETLRAAQELLNQVEILQGIKKDVAQSQQLWTVRIREFLRMGKGADLIKLLETLGREIKVQSDKRRIFISRPVFLPPNLENDPEIYAAVRNLSEGKSAFGIGGLIGRGEQKKNLKSIKILTATPSTEEDWSYVESYLSLLQNLRELALRWNVLAKELPINAVQGESANDALAAYLLYELYLKVKSVVESEIVVSNKAISLFPNWPAVRDIAESPQRLSELESALRHHLSKARLSNVWGAKENLQKGIDGCAGRVVNEIRDFLVNTLGNLSIDNLTAQAMWSKAMGELKRIQGLHSQLILVRNICQKIGDSGAPKYAYLLKQPLVTPVDALLPDNWRKCWRLKRLGTHLHSIDAGDELKKLANDRVGIEKDLSRAYQDIVIKRTWLKLAEKASPSIRAALQAYLTAIQKIGKGTGKRASRFRQDARMHASQANPAVPCWIMPHYRVSESLPAELGCFDLVIIDEASQSDFTALPALLRAKKVLVVGDDKQVSPEGVGLEEEKVRSLMSRFLTSQVETYRPQMSPDRSIYDLYKVVFATSSVMLKEHFRCVGAIIEYSKREFYDHQIRPLRIPRTSERLDPPLIDVIVTDGHRGKGDVNLPEARFIVDEIKAIVSDPKLSNRSIGVVSLLADKQALAIWDLLTEEVGPEEMQKHRLACGDARTFQGKERDIMFLSMVSAPNNIGIALSRDTFAQRFNVAASRAKDRMYLVRSVELDDLSHSDKLRRQLISHFSTPFAQDETRVNDLRSLCESPFEREMYDELTQRGYWITPQVKVGHYRIDLVVEGNNDMRLAVECDGDQYHGPDKWADDMKRQRTLERAGWVFWRCFASAFVRRRSEVIEDLIKTLSDRGIEPIGADGAPKSVHSEQRRVVALAQSEDEKFGEMAVAVENQNDVNILIEPVSDATPGNSNQTRFSAARDRLRASLSIDRKALEELQTSNLFSNTVADNEVASLTDAQSKTLDNANGNQKEISSDIDVADFCQRNGLKSADKRPQGGALWVFHDRFTGDIANQLKAAGFRWAKSNRAFWRKQ